MKKNEDVQIEQEGITFWTRNINFGEDCLENFGGKNKKNEGFKQFPFFF